MYSTYEALRVFVSSPSDVGRERKVVEKVIQDIGVTCKETLGVELECVTWENFVPQTPKLPEEKIQDILNAEISKCHIFILILWKRYGSKEPGRKKSNTERETEIALDLLKREKKIMFLTYFHDLKPDEDPGKQRRSVEVFRDMLQKQGVWYKGYKSVPQFQELLTHDLYRTIMRFRLSTKKHRSLSKFWVLGTPDRPTHPNLLIIYPAMERTFMGPLDDSNVWLNRLEPNIVFEDYKALQKLEKTIRLLGFRDYGIYNTANIPSDFKFMNRFWLCLPRNTRGLQQLKQYKEISRFNIIPRKKRAGTYFLWNITEDPNSQFEIRSPLAKYLEEQRSKMDVSGNWRFEMDRIIAKDYAILARFKDTRNDISMNDHFLNDFFLAGIRGLGTWGAAWFIDRKYHKFNKLDEKENFQYLLEVEYRDGRIFNVLDVSDKPKSYFDKEYKIHTIRKNISAYRT